MKKSILFMFLLPLFCGMQANAQRGQLEYALGLRLGTGTGVTLQYFYTDEHVFEGIVYTRWSGYSAGLLYEQHLQITDFKGLKWYFGGGMHAGRYGWFSGHPRWNDEPFSGHRTVAGLDGILGIEYFFHDVPLQMSVDWKPEYNLTGWVGWFPDGGAISIRWRI